jgi:hypothetical protein
MKPTIISSDNEYESPLRRALNKVQDVNVEAGINFLNAASKQASDAHGDGRYCTHHDDDPAHTEECYYPDQESRMENLKAFRDHLDKRITKLKSDVANKAEKQNEKSKHQGR